MTTSNSSIFGTAGQVNPHIQSNIQQKLTLDPHLSKRVEVRGLESFRARLTALPRRSGCGQSITPFFSAAYPKARPHSSGNESSDASSRQHSRLIRQPLDLSSASADQKSPGGNSALRPQKSHFHTKLSSCSSKDISCLPHCWAVFDGEGHTCVPCCSLSNSQGKCSSGW